MDLPTLDLPSLDLQSLGNLQSAADMPAGFAGFLGSMVEYINATAAWVAAQPAAPFVAAGTAVVVGMTLWLAGARVLKPALAILGTLWGAAAGAMLFPMLSSPGAPTPGNIDPAWIGLGCGGVLGLLATLMAFRTAISLSLGAVCAVLAFVATAGVIGVVQPVAHGAEHANAGTESARIWIVSHGDTPHASMGGSVRAGREITTDAPASVLGFTGPAARVETCVRDAFASAQSTWQTLPRSSQFMLLLGALGGALAGMILGLTATRSATALLTASVGSAAWLIGGAWLAHELAPSLLDRAGVQPIGWLVIWLTLAAAGMFMQRQRQQASAPVQPAAPVHAPQPRPL